MAGTATTNGQTNGHVNGHTNGTNGNKADESVTDAFVNLVVNTQQSDITSELSTKLKALLLDYLGVSAAAGHAANTTPHIIAGVRAFAGNATGSATVLTKGSGFLPQYAALINGALCHSYDFDDTHSGAILHPGCSLISAALAEAELLNSSGPELLVALAVGYEVCCRLGIALNTGSYRRGFHNTGTAGIFGSVASVCKLRRSSPQVVKDAFGLALSKAGGSMQFLENGSWNKRLHPGWAAHDAIMCVCLAEAGVIGASNPFDGKYGATALFSEDGDPSAMTKDLGTYWTFVQTACKPFPACRMTHGLLEMTNKLKKQYPEKGLPVKFHIDLPKANYPIVGLPAPNKIAPASIVDAQFSSYFQTAASWIYGSKLGWAIYEHINEPEVVDLAKRGTCAIDESYLNLESRLTVTFSDGTVAVEEVIFPLAEPQRPFEWDSGVQKKFLGMAEPVFGEDGAQAVCRAVDGIEGFKDVTELMRLVANDVWALSFME